MYTTLPKSQTLVRSFFNRTYSWMTAGLALTAVIAYLTAQNQVLLGRVIDNYVLLIVAQFGIVLGLSFLINRVSATVASVLFMLYSALTGLTFATLFLRYSAGDITAAFGVSAGMFGAMSLIGYTTKRDLTRFGGILLMALIGLVVASIVNIFLASGPLTWIISILGVILFSALTAYDTQKIKEMYFEADAHETRSKKIVAGALSLYMDFINLFLFLLRFFGSSRD